MAVAALIAVFLVVHVKFLTGAVTVSWDTLAWSMLLEYVKEVVHSGYFPDWNPYFSAGEPLYLYHYSYAMWQWFVFILIDYIIPVDDVTLFSSFILFLFVFYNVGCYLFFTKLFDDGRVVLFCFAASLMTLGFVMYFQEHTFLYTSLYVPYMLYLFLEVMEEKNYYALPLLLGLLGIAANIYEPHFAVLATLVFAGSYFVFMKRERYSVPPARVLARHGIGGVVMMGALMLPAVFVFLSFSDYISPIRGSLEAISVTEEMGVGSRNSYGSVINFFSASSNSLQGALLFVGTLPLALVFIGLFKSTNRFRPVAALATVVLFLLSLGPNSFFYTFIKYLPTFNYIRQFTVFEVYTLLFTISLAGMGLEYLSKRADGEWGKAKRAVLASFAVVLAAAVLKASTEKVLSLRFLTYSSLYVIVFIASFIALYYYARTRSEASGRVLIATLVVGLASYQLYFGYFLYPQIAHTLGKGQPEQYAAVMREDFEFEWKGSRAPLYKQQLFVLGYTTFEAPLKRVEADFIIFEPTLIEPGSGAALEEGSIEEVITPALVEAGTPADRIFFAKSIMTSKRHHTFMNHKPDPRIFGLSSPKLFLTGEFTVKDTAQEVLEDMDLFSFLTGSEVIIALEELDGKALPGRGGQGWGNRAGATVSVDEYGPNGLRLTVNAPGEALLVYLQSHNEDWRAYVNGEEQPIFLTNYAFQSVVVPAGESTVELRFSSPYRWLLTLHLFGSVAVICSLAALSITRRREGLETT